MNVSAVLIVKNEEKRLRDCLASLCWASEIIVLDSGSEDETVAIAREYTDRVYVNTQWGGFGPQRQLAQTYATSDWILAIDADEIVTDDLKQAIQLAVQGNDDSHVYAINRKNWAFGKFIHFSGWSPDWVVRLYPRAKTTYCDSLVHESVVLPSTMSMVHLPKKSRLLHYTYDDLYDYNRKVSGYLKSWADQREGHKKSSVFKGLVHGVFAFLRMYILRLGFLDGRHGFVLAFLTGCTTSMKYFDLWLRKYEAESDD
jgi:(heptosyl)LPS beta-1,4-glucosyltransferase